MKRILPFIGLVSVLSAMTRADGVPEPGIVLYGNVTNANRVLRSGFLSVEFSGPNSKVVRITSQLNATGPYGYRLRVPFEAVVGGNLAASDTYELDGRTVAVRLTAPATYRTAGTNSFAATFSLAGAEVVLPAGERGVVREVNFSVPGTLPSSGSARLAEARIPLDAPGNDAGQPVEPAFQFTSIGATEEPGILVEWTGAPVNRGYYLLRASDMATEPDDFQVVRFFPASPQPVNWFWDTNTVEATTYFYRLFVP